MEARSCAAKDYCNRLTLPRPFVKTRLDDAIDQARDDAVDLCRDGARNATLMENGFLVQNPATHHCRK
jgi:hypothetical protein